MGRIWAGESGEGRAPALAFHARCTASAAPPTLRRQIMNARDGNARVRLADCARVSAAIRRAGRDLSRASRSAMIVPFPAGSATDGQARLIGAHFQKVFGHGFIVENMPGATGAIAARTVAKAAPDGYTLLLSSVSTHSANAYLYNNLGYDPIADFTPVALIARAPSGMVVREETPYPHAEGFRRLREGQSRQAQFRLRQYGQPRRRRDAQCGAPASRRRPSPIAARRRRRPTCSPDRSTLSSWICRRLQEHIKAGKLRLLATTGSKRLETFPEAPTMVEFGYPDLRAVLMAGRARTCRDAGRDRRNARTRRSAMRSTRPRANASSPPTAPKPAR